MGTKVYCGEHADWGEVAVKVMLTASMEAQDMPGKRSAAAKETQVLQRRSPAHGTGSDNVIKYRCMELCLCSLFDVVVRPVSGLWSADRRYEFLCACGNPQALLPPSLLPPWPTRCTSSAWPWLRT